MIKKEITNINSKIVYKITANQFKKIPGYPIAYWVNNEMRNIFSRGENMQSYATPRQGFATGNNDQFLRLWYEVENKKSLLNSVNRETTLVSKKMVPCNKGGKFKLSSNNMFIVNWENNGQEMKNFKGSVIRNGNFYFLEGITWSTIRIFSNEIFTSRILFETKGSVCFPSKNNSWEIPLAIRIQKLST